MNCKQCLLPAKAPGANINKNGICAFCRGEKQNDQVLSEQDRLKKLQELENILYVAKQYPTKPYDAVVCLSGGKDSILLLYKLKVEYGLNVVAFTTDMNIPEIAWENIRRTVKQLEVDHVIHTPNMQFYEKMYRWLLRNQEERGAVRTVCYVCAPLFEGDALRYATLNKIPLVFAGYAPGQPDPVERMVFEYSKENINKDWTPDELRSSGEFTEEELACFWNPHRFPSNTKFPRYIAPFHAWPYNQEHAIQQVVDLGLVKTPRQASPIHSNCPLNWLLMYSDLKHLGYNPYAPEFASLVRDQRANKFYWKVAQPLINAMIRWRVFLGRNVTRNLKWLNLKPRDLKITRPAPLKNK